jgi:hypothetical protein
MNRVAKWIENRRHIASDFAPMHPDIRHGQRQIFGESSRPIHSHSFGISAQMSPARETVTTSTTNNMTLATDHLPWKKIFNIRPDFNNLTDELMTYHHRHGDGFARPIVPIINVQIRAANTGAIDANQDVVEPDNRFWNILEPKPGLCLFLNKCFHDSFSVSDGGCVVPRPAAAA